MGHLADPLSAAGRMELVTKANTDLSGTTKALLVGTAGTANVMDENGTIHADVPLQQGYNPLRLKQIRTGGDADDIWALF